MSVFILVWLLLGADTSEAATTNYYTIRLQPGFNLIANHLDRGANRVGDVFDTAYAAFPGATVWLAPAGLEAIVFTNGQSFAEFEFFDMFRTNGWPGNNQDEFGGGWTNPNAQWTAGEGMLFNHPRDIQDFTFCGLNRVASGRVRTIPAGGCCLLAAETLTNATYQIATGMEPVEGTRVSRLSTNSFFSGLGVPDYVIYDFANGLWSPEEPVLRIGEAAWYCAPAPEMKLNVNDQRAVLTWPTNSIRYAVQSSENPANASSWQAVDAIMSTNGSSRTVTVPMATDRWAGVLAVKFRLHARRLLQIGPKLAPGRCHHSQPRTAAPGVWTFHK